MGWIHVGVITNIDWPETEQTIEYSGRKFLLRPARGVLHAPDICLQHDDQSHIPGYTAVLEFMSVLCWLKGQKLDERLPGWTSGNRLPGQSGPGPQFQNVGERLDIELFPDLSHPKAKLGLALYREAVGIRSIPFKFLAFWKLASLIAQDGTEQQFNLIENIISKLEYPNELGGMKSFFASGKTIQEFIRSDLYGANRCAVAHATSGKVINPDDPLAVSELNLNMGLIHEIAKKIIEDELGVASELNLYAKVGRLPPTKSMVTVFPFLQNRKVRWSNNEVFDKDV